MNRRAILLVILSVSCGKEPNKDSWTCADVAAAVQRQCVDATDEPCDVYLSVYDVCRKEVEAGRDVRVGSYGNRYVRGEDQADPQPAPESE